MTEGESLRIREERQSNKTTKSGRKNKKDKIFANQ